MNNYILLEVAEYNSDDCENLKLQAFVPFTNLVRNREPICDLREILLENYLIGILPEKTWNGDCLDVFDDDLDEIAWDLMTEVEPYLAVYFISHIQKYYEPQQDGDREDYKEWRRYRTLIDFCLEFQLDEMKDIPMITFLLKIFDDEILNEVVNDQGDLNIDYLAWKYGFGRCNHCRSFYLSCAICRDKKWESE
jgi:hypothetical protein